MIFHNRHFQQAKSKSTKEWHEDLGKIPCQQFSKLSAEGTCHLHQTFMSYFSSEEVLVQMNGIGVNQPGNFHVWLSISHHRAGVNTLG